MFSTIKLKFKSEEKLFLPARYVWIELETFADTRKVVRAIIFTMQYIKPTECHQLVKDFSKFIEERSSVVRSYYFNPNSVGLSNFK